MSKFYLGRHFDQAANKTSEQPLEYDSRDLTTHAVIVGMTGSGKTGLCLDMMEEAALNQIPALMLDPKGDITNALLHFPDLLPVDFEPWVNADQARRAGKEVAQVAAETAELWRNGLGQWGIGSERIRRLKHNAQFAVYTPGSFAGIPVSIIASLAAPTIPWEENRESLREQISATVTALLSLIGQDNVDPVRDREHILLANIFEHNWSQGRDLSLGDLIMMVKNPPFDKLGFFDVSVFFPDRDRFNLAMQLNNILAAPSFQSWIEGEPLDIGHLLFMPDGRPRHSIFYIAHLSDTERMFFTTLFYGAIESWMRTQSGTGSLRALVYFDEIFGYLPPVGNPPSKEPMLRLLKQARAFGVGMVLATQNPVDIDYKALSNAGTWFIGKLATERDKQRLLDGLDSASGLGMARSEYDRLISSLGMRVFLMRNVHEKQPALFQTRWAMNYLAGPVTRQQIPALNSLAGYGQSAAVAHTSRSAAVPAAAPAGMPAAGTAAPPAAPAAPAPAAGVSFDAGTRTRSQVPARIAEYFFRPNLNLREAADAARRTMTHDSQLLGVIYYPILLAQAHARIDNRKYGVTHDLAHLALIREPDRRGAVRWDNYAQPTELGDRDFDRQPEPDARFGSLEPPLTDATTLRSLERDFADWVYRSTSIEIRANEQLKVYAGPDQSPQEFEAMVQQAAQQGLEADKERAEVSLGRKYEQLKSRLSREQQRLLNQEERLGQRRQQELVSHGETILGLLGIFGRKRSLSTAMSKRGMTAQAKRDMERSAADVERVERELAALEEEQERTLAQLEEKWHRIAADVTTVTVQPFKKDIAIDRYGVAWLPHYVVQQGDRLVELPAFEFTEHQ